MQISELHAMIKYLHLKGFETSRDQSCINRTNDKYSITDSSMDFNEIPHRLKRYKEDFTDLYVRIKVLNAYFFHTPLIR